LSNESSALQRPPEVLLKTVGMFHRPPVTVVLVWSFHAEYWMASRHTKAKPRSVARSLHLLPLLSTCGWW
jgi:hypothetical protein